MEGKVGATVPIYRMTNQEFCAPLSFLRSADDTDGDPSIYFVNMSYH